MSTGTSSSLLARYTERGWEGEKNRKRDKERRRLADTKPREKKKLRDHRGNKARIGENGKESSEGGSHMRRIKEQTQESGEKSEKGRGLRRRK